MNRLSCRLFFFLCSLLRFPAAIAFVHRPMPTSFGTLQRQQQQQHHQQQRSKDEVGLLASPRTFSTSSSSSRKQGGAQQQQELQRQRQRRVLLNRTGPHFQLNRFSGQIEFGATAKLTTKLVDTEPRLQDINTWLKDERGLAMSIWDEKLTTDLGNHLYRLQIMTLQFVTMQLSPWVDVRMQTVMMMDNPQTTTTNQQQQQPVFTLDSVNFDPNIELLPGMKISAESLGIVIEMAGEMRALLDGTGVTGKITFQTSGSLPPPMRILPDAVLQAASDSINETVANFAIASFQRGARAQFRSFLKKQQQEEEQRKRKLEQEQNQQDEQQ